MTKISELKKSVEKLVKKFTWEDFVVELKEKDTLQVQDEIESKLQGESVSEILNLIEINKWIRKLNEAIWMLDIQQQDFSEITDEIKLLQDYVNAIAIPNEVTVKNFPAKQVIEWEVKIKDEVSIKDLKKLSDSLLEIKKAIDEGNKKEMKIDKVDFNWDVNVKNIGKIEKVLWEIQGLLSKINTVKTQKVEVVNQLREREFPTTMKVILDWVSLDAVNKSDFPLPVRLSDGEKFYNGMAKAVGGAIMASPRTTSLEGFSGTCKSTAVTVWLTAVLLPTSSLGSRKSMEITNNSTNTIFIGWSDVTVANWVPLFKKSTKSIPAWDWLSVYAISDVAGNDVRTLEIS